MSDITPINGTDRVRDSRSVINTNFANLNTDLIAAEADIVALETTSNALLPTAAQKAALAGDSGTPSDSNRYVLESSPLLGGISLTAGETINGATTPVPVWQNKTDNELYACDANDNTRYGFIGFVTSDSTDGNPINFQGSGVVSGFTGLAEGEKYYVQDTVGTIGLTPGTMEIFVGVAISETQLLIQKGSRKISGNGGSLGSASSSLSVTCGFRPSKVRIRAHCVWSSSSFAYSDLDLVWANNTISGLSAVNIGSSSSFLENSARLYGGSTSSFMTFTITSVSGNGFTITWTESSSFVPGEGAFFYYEAEGEL